MLTETPTPFLRGHYPAVTAQARPGDVHIFYHVTLRGNLREALSFTPHDPTLLNDIVTEVITPISAHLHATCRRTNHMDMLLQVGNAPFRQWTLRIADRYTHHRPGVAAPTPIILVINNNSAIPHRGDAAYNSGKY